MVTVLDQLGTFYLGRRFDAATGTTTSEAILYDSRDLVTHAVIVGMTGSGKTGFAMTLLEEAAMDKVPAIVIDPKGDMGNLLLQFPELRASDFLPWLDEAEAARNSKTLDQYAASQSELWRNGLKEWQQDGERIRRLQAAAEFSIYTPGGLRGRPLSLLRRLAAPAGIDASDVEALSDAGGAAASAILALAGIEAEPGRSREHILLSNIIEGAWQEGCELSLEDLIHRTQSPSFERVGVLDLESFYPKSERFRLALELNNLLASSSYSSWLEGEPLDIDRLLHTAEGRPRVSIISIAHLNDSERMFVVTLLLNEVLAWTRRQKGTSSLRAIVYMDEIYGYFPPVENPPSKKPLLTLLKQARAFGVGVVLATQNPADLDYKGLANTGTWFVGRLQTERDKQRLLEGLENASAASKSEWSRTRLDDLLSSLGKRVFLMNNVHETGPVLLQSRWALSYLKGPLTWDETCRLASKVDGPKSETSAPAVRQFIRGEASGSKPVLPPGVHQLFATVNGAVDVGYEPYLLAGVEIHYTDAKARVDQRERSVLLFPFADASGQPDWDSTPQNHFQMEDFSSRAPENGRYGNPPSTAANSRAYSQWSKDAAHWLVTRRELRLFHAPALKLYSAAGESEGAFRKRVEQEVRERRDAGITKLQARHATKLAAARERVRRAQQALEKELGEARSEAVTGMVSVGAGVFGALFGRKRLTTAVRGVARSVQRASKDGHDVRRAEENLQAAASALQHLEEQTNAELEQLGHTFAESGRIEEYPVRAKKSGVRVETIALAWVPSASDAS
jgi:hypothetical protein